MPLFGIIQDSPILYFGQRVRRRVANAGQVRRAFGGGSGLGRGGVGISMRFGKLVFRRPVLDHMLNDPSGDVGVYLAMRGRRILAAARAQVGVNTGALKTSLHMRHGRSGPGQYIKIGSPLKYALAHHEGTRPHVITPKRAEVLRFSSRGRIVYARVVRHPGTKPNKYLTDNLYLIR